MNQRTPLAMRRSGSRLLLATDSCCTRALAIVLVAAIWLLPAYTQNQDPTGDTPVFKKDVKVVNLFATVRDKHGQIMPSLAKEDFQLQVDGKPQTSMIEAQ